VNLGTTKEVKRHEEKSRRGYKEIIYKVNKQCTVFDTSASMDCGLHDICGDPEDLQIESMTQSFSSLAVDVTKIINTKMVQRMQFETETITFDYV